MAFGFDDSTTVFCPFSSVEDNERPEAIAIPSFSN
ncbi:MAG: hypothetical protein ACI843_001592 [Psychrobacter glaciei]|jgi:hypothetical protein